MCQLAYTPYSYAIHKQYNKYNMHGTITVSIQRFIEVSFQKILVAVKTAVCFCAEKHKWWKI